VTQPTKDETECTERNHEVAAVAEQHAARRVYDRRAAGNSSPILGAPSSSSRHDRIAGRDCLELVFRGSKLEPRGTGHLALGARVQFRGPLALAEANMSHLIRDFQRSRPRRLCQLRGRVGRDSRRRRQCLQESSSTVAGDVTAACARCTRRARRAARELDMVGQILEAGSSHFDRFLRLSS